MSGNAVRSAVLQAFNTETSKTSDAEHYCPAPAIAREQASGSKDLSACAVPGRGISVGTNQNSGTSHDLAPLR